MQAKTLRWVLLALLLISSLSTAAKANSRTLKVGVVDDQPPCSDKVNRTFKGSAVDIWQQVALRSDLRFELQMIPSAELGIRKAAAGDIDLVISCLNITPYRLQRVSFSTPYSDDGLALLTKKKDTSFADLVQRLSNDRVIRETTAWLLIGGLIFASALWFLSKEFQHRDIVGANKRQTFYKGWMMLAMGTGIYKMGTAEPSMSVIALSNFIRLVTTSIFVAATTSLLIKASSPSDITETQLLKTALQGKIGVDQDTFAQTWLERRADDLLSVDDQLKAIVPIASGDEMISQLEQEKIGSILADTKTIEYLKSKLDHPKNYEVIAQTFFRTPQAFAFGSKLNTESQATINLALSELQFEGEIESIINRWKTNSN
jgi:polar amino acid transport system substrate-binding protein